MRLFRKRDPHFHGTGIEERIRVNLGWYIREISDDSLSRAYQAAEKSALS
jgi:hypothetical protein